MSLKKRSKVIKQEKKTDIIQEYFPKIEKTWIYRIKKHNRANEKLWGFQHILFETYPRKMSKLQRQRKNHLRIQKKVQVIYYEKKKKMLATTCGIRYWKIKGQSLDGDLRKCDCSVSYPNKVPFKYKGNKCFSTCKKIQILDPSSFY